MKELYPISVIKNCKDCDCCKKKEISKAVGRKAKFKYYCTEFPFTILKNIALWNFDTDTLTITAQSGAEHNGSAYGNGARVNCGTVGNKT